MTLVDEPHNLNLDEYRRFIALRCTTLSRALIDLSEAESARRDLGRVAVEGLLDRDNALKRKGAVSGFIVPRYIAEELARAEQDWNRPWLRRQGELLRAAGLLETTAREAWNEAVGTMITDGEGRRFLVAQMIKRLGSSDVTVVRMAEGVLVEYVADEAIESLVAASHLTIGAQPGVFSQRTTQALAKIGPRAVPAMLRVFEDDKGAFLPATDGNWRTRRHMARALGMIGDRRAAPVLIRELSEMTFDTDESRFIYTQVLIEAIGKSAERNNPAAIEAIAKAWRRDASDLTPMARDALFLLTGSLYRKVEDVPTRQ